jgi:hypothetical protein
MTPVVVMVCFIVGISMFSTISMTISSGVSTTFVCLAEDPQALQRTQPELFEKVRYPRIYGHYDILNFMSIRSAKLGLV